MRVNVQKDKRYRPVKISKVRPMMAINTLKHCDFNRDGKVSKAELSIWLKLNRRR